MYIQTVKFVCYLYAYFKAVCIHNWWTLPWKRLFLQLLIAHSSFSRVEACWAFPFPSYHVCCLKCKVVEPGISVTDISVTQFLHKSNHWEKGGQKESKSQRNRGFTVRLHLLEMSEVCFPELTHLSLETLLLGLFTVLPQVSTCWASFLVLFWSRQGLSV